MASLYGGKALAIWDLTEPLNGEEVRRETYPAMIEEVVTKGMELDFVE